MSTVFVPIHIHHHPATCPSCQRPEDIKEVCNHCGYVYVKEESKTGFWGYVGWMLLVILTLILLLLTLVAVDEMAFSGKYMAVILYKPNCEFEITPDSGYKLVYSQDKELYAISHGNDEFLTSVGGKIYSTTIEISRPALFYDSCVAKAYLQAYLIQQLPKEDKYKFK